MKLSLLILLFLGIHTIGISQCDEFEVSMIANHPTCFGFSDGSVTANPSGGAEPYDITIKNEDGDIVNMGGSPTANTLTAGWYYITVFDIEGCDFSDSVELMNPLPINIDDQTIVDHSGDGLCNGSITINSVPGYDIAELSFFWSPDLVDGSSGLGANEYTSACPGGYVLTINDPSGCSGVFELTVGGELSSIAETEYEKQLFVSTFIGQWTVNNEVNLNEAVEIRIFNLLGKEVYQSTLVQGMNTFYLSYDGVLIYEISSKNKVLKSGKLSVVSN